MGELQWKEFLARNGSSLAGTQTWINIPQPHPLKLQGVFQEKAQEKEGTSATNNPDTWGLRWGPQNKNTTGCKRSTTVSCQTEMLGYIV